MHVLYTLITDLMEDRMEETSVVFFQECSLLCIEHKIHGNKRDFVNSLKH